MLAAGDSIIVAVIPEKRNEPRLNSPCDLLDLNFGGVVSGLLLLNEAGGFFLPMLPKNFRWCWSDELDVRVDSVELVLWPLLASLFFFCSLSTSFLTRR